MRPSRLRLLLLVLASVFVGLASGCSLLFATEAQCATDEDCGNASVCRASLCVAPDTPSDGTAAWVMAYFRSAYDLDSDSLHLAYSTDGLHWTELAGGGPAYRLSGIGSNHIRDPFVYRKRDGTFVYVATDWTIDTNPGYWDNPSSSVIVADSVDLITFTNPRRLQVTDLPGPNGTEMHAWAPEVIWDDERETYAILFAGNDTSGENVIYASYTSDFQTVEDVTPTVYFDPGYSVIDATIFPHDGRQYMFFKDETDNSGSPLTGSGKDIQVARTTGTSLAPGGFVRWDPDYLTRGTSQSVRRATEGPFVIKPPNVDIWYVCVDYFLDNGRFGCWSTPDLDADPSSWTELSSGQFNFPAGARHASTVRVTQAELDALIAHYGEPENFRIRTSYSEGGAPFYMAHSWYHGVIAADGDMSGNLLSGDRVWRIVPGLADPTDPDLVSFEAVTVPGYFLTIDTTTAYPPCDQGSNHGSFLCSVPSGDRPYLAKMIQRSDDPTFQQNATFRRSPGLDGASNTTSFQWTVDPTRYLRHSSYQVLALTLDGTPQQDVDASFVLEPQ